MIPESLLNTAPSLPLHRVCMLSGQSLEHLLSLVRARQAHLAEETATATGGNSLSAASGKSPQPVTGPFHASGCYNPEMQAQKCKRGAAFLGAITCNTEMGKPGSFHSGRADGL